VPPPWPGAPQLPTEIELRPIVSLLSYARNSRTHTDAQVAQIAASIREFGWTVPILVGADGTVLAGHARLQGARKLGLTSVPVIELAHLDAAQRRAYVPGFSSQEIGALLPDDDVVGDGAPAEEEVPTVQAQIAAHAGDMWLLGRHRVPWLDNQPRPLTASGSMRRRVHTRIENALMNSRGLDGRIRVVMRQHLAKVLPLSRHACGAELASSNAMTSSKARQHDRGGTGRSGASHRRATAPPPRTPPPRRPRSRSEMPSEANRRSPSAAMECA
jgi:hypothetical protein